MKCTRFENLITILKHFYYEWNDYREVKNRNGGSCLLEETGARAGD